MNDEIKEILERPNVYSFNDECYLYFGDYNKLKDYITNLQQEKEDYKSRIEKALLIIEKQKKKMYKSRNKIAMFILIKLDNILNGRSDE